MSSTEKTQCIVCLTKRIFGSLENTNVLIRYMAKTLQKIYTYLKLIKSINSRPENKIFCQKVELNII